jgi:hypothetical protein
MLEQLCMLSRQGLDMILTNSRPRSSYASEQGIMRKGNLALLAIAIGASARVSLW